MAALFMDELSVNLGMQNTKHSLAGFYDCKLNLEKKYECTNTFPSFPIKNYMGIPVDFN